MCLSLLSLKKKAANELERKWVGADLEPGLAIYASFLRNLLLDF